MKPLHKFLAAALFAAPMAAFAHPIAAAGTEGLSVLVGSNGGVVATYQGNSASYSNDLYLVTNDGIDNNDIFLFNNLSSTVGSSVNLGAFTAGTELVFRLFVNNTGNNFYTGGASRNADNSFHARVEQNWMGNSTLVSFEDLYAGPFDFNDLSFSFTNTATQIPNPVPEPASMLLLGLGLAGLAKVRHRKQT